MRKLIVDFLLIMTLIFHVFGDPCALAQDNTTPPADSSTVIPQKSDEKSEVAAPPKVVIPVAREPYSVLVEVGFSGPATQRPQLRRDLVDEIRKCLDRMYGAAWNAQVFESKWLIPGSRDRLDRLSAEELLTRYPESAAQKVFLVAIDDVGGSFQTSCREFDTRIQETSTVLVEYSADEQTLAGIACRLVRDSFRPVLQFTKPPVAGDELEFLLQAGELTVPDPTAAFIREGDVLRPFIRQLDRRNPDKPKALRRLDLCYVRVTGFNDELRADVSSTDDSAVSVKDVPRDTSAVYHDTGHVRGILISHGPVAFGRTSRGMQQIAVRQRPAATNSRVKLVLHTRPDQPLICFRVDKVAKLRHSDENTSPSVRVLSDRNGEIKIDVDPEHPTLWLYVYSGSTLLARVPYAPGLIPLDTIKLPDDGLRLGVEGELFLFRDALVDTVAQKAVLISLAKKASEEGKPEEVDRIVGLLDAMPDEKEFLSRLNAIKTPAAAKADQQHNPTLKRKVERLCQSMEKSLTEFYSADNKIVEAEELEKLRAYAERVSTKTP